MKDGYDWMRRTGGVANPLLPSECSTEHVVLPWANPWSPPAPAEPAATSATAKTAAGRARRRARAGAGNPAPAAGPRAGPAPGRDALADVQTHYAVDTHANRKLQAIRELMDAPASENPNGSKRQHE